MVIVTECYCIKGRRFEVNDGLWGVLGLQWVLGIGLVPLAVMVVSSFVFRPPGSMSS